MKVIRPMGKGLLIGVALLLVVVSAQAQVTKFSTDVSTAIDRGLAYLDSLGAYANPSSAGDAAGLVALALMEKRSSADQSAPSQGYNGASAADKVRIQNIITYIINRGTVSFYAYRNGQEMMALSLYLRTGGPSQAAALLELNRAFDESMNVIPQLGGEPDIAAWHGYWCYTATNCRDSSTTQFIMSGLAAAKSVYTDPAYSDSVRLTRLNNVVAKTRTAYFTYGTTGGCNAGGVLSPTEKGHGYNQGNQNSLQQTAAGTWIQMVGGADLHDPGVQSYLEWLRNRYNYQSIWAAPNYCGYSWNGAFYSYYLWSSSKAYTFLDESGVTPVGSELNTASLGVLPAGDAPAFATRLLHLDPAVVPRVASFGLGGAGYYNEPSESPRWYFDYAYTLLSRQDASGYFTQPTAVWGDGSPYADQSYSLLVLVRSVGGGCVDTDNDGVCDEVDSCPVVSNPNQEDIDNDGLGDACDRCPDQPGPANNGGCPTVPPVKLNVATSPSYGTAGVTAVNITGSGFPTANGAIAPADVTIKLSLSCNGAVAASTTGTKVVKILGSTNRITFTLPASLSAADYYASINGKTADGTQFNSGATCSKVIVKVVP